jgi:hypothetical protein
MRDNSIKAWFPESFVSVLAVLQVLQQEFLKTGEINQQIVNEKFFEMSYINIGVLHKFKEIRHRIPAQTRIVLLEQIDRLQKCGLDSCSSFIEMKMTGSTKNFEEKIGDLLKFWKYPMSGAV